MSYDPTFHFNTTRLSIVCAAFLAALVLIAVMAVTISGQNGHKAYRIHQASVDACATIENHEARTACIVAVGERGQ